MESSHGGASVVLADRRAPAMPNVTYDGRSFMLDGRRVWLVGGSVPMGRIARDQWADRIHAAKLAGLNMIETPVFWSRHEPRAGKLDFTGENDLRHFVKLVHAAGMYCVVRLGPFVGSGWDLGGLPSWLLDNPNTSLRRTNPTFLDACAKFLAGVVEQFRDLQVSSPGRGGPVIAAQCEAEWTCGDDVLASSYLGELDRFLRESGLTVPILNSNNLWNSVEGQIDGWSGDRDLLSTMRQLSAVRGDQPRFVVSFASAPQHAFGEPPADAPEGWVLQRRLAETMAGGGQFTLDPFAAGTTGGYWTGRLADGQDAMATPSFCPDAPIGESGAPNATLPMVRRLCLFASRFGKVLAGLDPTYQPIAMHPSGSDVEQPAVIHSMGPQGAVVFVFAKEPGASPTNLLLPDGQTMPVSFGTQAVAWCLFDTNVTPRAHIDYTNLNAMGIVGKVFVAHAPAGARAVISVNGGVYEQAVPSAGETPRVVEHEGLHLLILCEELADQTFFTDSDVYVGVVGLTHDSKPVVSAAAKSYFHVTSEGVLSTKPAHGPKAVAVPAIAHGHERATMGDWWAADVEPYVTGQSPRFAAISGPADLSTLGSPAGYGWYRLTMKQGSSRKVRMAAPGGGDRLHFFTSGQASGVMGIGEGAVHTLAVPVHKGTEHLVILAENAGRASGGTHMADRKGLPGHVYEVETIKAGKPKLVRGEPMDPLAFRTPLWEVRPGDSTDHERVTWAVPHRKKTPVIVHFDNLPARGLLVVDNKALAFVDQAGPASIMLEADLFTKGTATIQLALLSEEPVDERLAAKVGDAVSFEEAISVVSEDAQWSFAKWEAPTATSFKPVKGKGTGVPMWWRSTFKASRCPAPLYIDAAGLSKGQLYVNGRHLCRYLVASAAGRAVPGQQRYFVPSSWLRGTGENELMIFDEHGASPLKVKVSFDHAKTPIIPAAPIVAS